MSKLILLRHGKSIWNKLNLFSGWVDISLSKEGIEEAVCAGKMIKDCPIDVIYTSELIRAQTTAFVAMAEHSSGKVPCLRHKQEGGEWYEKGLKTAFDSLIPTYIARDLNERMYGDLQGKNKAETIKQYGAEQVQLWRRSFREAPPGGESLEKVAKRAIPFFKERILPHLENGEHVLICAHGNSLRAIVMYLQNLSEEEVLHLEIPTGSCLQYEYQEGGSFLPIDNPV